MGHSEPAGFDYLHLYPWGTCAEQGTITTETPKLCSGRDKRALTVINDALRGEVTLPPLAVGLRPPVGKQQPCANLLQEEQKH